MKYTMHIRNLRTLPVLVLAVLAFAAVRGEAQAAPDENPAGKVLTLDIPAQEAGSALIALAVASGVHITFADDQDTHNEVEALKGKYRLEEALAALLTNTGLKHEYGGENLVLVQPVGPARETDSDEDEEAKEEEEEAPLQLGEQHVTGSRMRGGDPTTNVITLTAEDIARRGISSVEEIFRDMPWAYASNTTQSSVGASISGDVDSGFGTLGLGMSSINLRALGSQATLVLINGRRVGGLGGLDSDIVNLMNVPLSAIERVDIELGSASAIYGADAIGGVVNFITKKGYTGLEATLRQEYSATDAHRNQVSLRGGYSWGSGNLNAMVARTESDPINNRKIWTSNDFRDQFGPEYDLRDYAIGQPGIVCVPRPSRVYIWCDWPYVYYQLSPGHSGVGATMDDFTTDITPTDYVTPYNGADSESLSFNGRVEQTVGEDMLFFGEAQLSDHDAFREFPTQLDSYLIPASNAYNPFGRDMVAFYFPIREVESGLFPARSYQTENARRTYTAGLVWRARRGHELNLSWTRSETKLFSVHNDVNYEREEDDPTATDFYLALESSDPDVALNPFGDGSAQGSHFSQFLSPYYQNHGNTTTSTIEMLLRGQLFDLWGGPVTYVLGGESRERQIALRRRSWTDRNQETEVQLWESRGFDNSQPQMTILAGFMELGLPLVGDRNARTGLKGLFVSLQARHDHYVFEGPVSGTPSEGRFSVDPALYRRWVPGIGWSDLPGWTFTKDTPVEVTEKARSELSPRIGLQYKPADSFTLRAAWTRSFRPPNLSQQFTSHGESHTSLFWTDPLHPSGEPTRVVVRNRTFFANANLKAEYAEKRSLGIEWNPLAAPGLRWTVDWSEINFTDKIQHSNVLRYSFPHVYAADPSLVTRDENGNALTLVNHLVNIASKVSEILDSSIQYTFDTDFGRFSSRLMYSRTLQEYYQVVSDLAEPRDRVSTVHGSDRYSLRGELSWLWRNMAADLFVYHRPGYENTAVGYCQEWVGRCAEFRGRRPPLELGSFTKFDLTLTYQFDNGLRVRAGGRNIFKRMAPTVYGDHGYDMVRWDARSRVLFLELHWAM